MVSVALSLQEASFQVRTGNNDNLFWAYMCSNPNFGSNMSFCTNAILRHIFLYLSGYQVR